MDQLTYQYKTEKKRTDCETRDRNPSFWNNRRNCLYYVAGTKLSNGYSDLDFFSETTGQRNCEKGYDQVSKLPQLLGKWNLNYQFNSCFLIPLIGGIGDI